MFLIKKKRRKLADDMDIVFKELLNLNDKILYHKKATYFLQQVESYLQTNNTYIFTRFSNDEFIFSKKISSLKNIELSSLKKYFPFLQSQSEKVNREIILELDNLFYDKMIFISRQYTSDIQAVNDYLKYAKERIKSSEIFYYTPDYNEVNWTKNNFLKNLSNYFQYKLRQNPKNLNSNYINDMKGYYSIISLGLDNKAKTDLANNYFKTNKDAFNFGFNSVQEKYNEVVSEIKMVPVLMSMSENQLQDLINHSIETYNK